jgi:hypothetical protein
MGTASPVRRPRERSPPDCMAGRSAGTHRGTRQQSDSIALLPIQLNQTAGGETSQHGDDAVFDAVFGAIGVRSRTCVEFGAYDLKTYSNIYPPWTVGWRALLIEGDPVRHAKVCADYRAHPQHTDTRVEIENRFVAESGPDSLPHILEEHGFPTDMELVSIDVDGL